MDVPDAPLPLRPTALAHLMVARAMPAGGLAVDATCGNGHDTEFLARLAGSHGTVVAIDVQAAAIQQARDRIAAADMDDGRVRFVQGCHTTMGDHIVPGSAHVVMFNLGYLPGGDHALTTRADTTPVALEAAAHVLRPGGLLAVTCYPGHPEGADEADAVADWMRKAAGHGVRVAQYAQPFTLRPSPMLWLAVM